jgi:hypothetical protein
MSANLKKSMGSAVVLVLFGIAALYGGAKSLVVLIPAALLIWYGGAPILRTGRNWPAERE